MNIPRRQTDVHNLNTTSSTPPPWARHTDWTWCVCVSLCVRNFPDDDDDLHPQTPASNSAHTRSVSCHPIATINFSSCFLLMHHSIYHHGNKR